jgi:hypothetical protein
MIHLLSTAKPPPAGGFLSPSIQKCDTRRRSFLSKAMHKLDCDRMSLSSYNDDKPPLLACSLASFCRETRKLLMR